MIEKRRSRIRIAVAVAGLGRTAGGGDRVGGWGRTAAVAVRVGGVRRLYSRTGSLVGEEARERSL